MKIIHSAFLLLCHSLWDLVSPPISTIILCDGKITNSGNYRDNLQEKYFKQQMFKHFANMHAETDASCFKSEMFNAKNIFARSTLDDKIFSCLEMNLNDSTFHYAN